MESISERASDTESFLIEFQELIDSKIKENDLKLPLISSNSFSTRFDRKKKTEGKNCVNESKFLKKIFKSSYIMKNRKWFKIITKKKNYLRYFKYFATVLHASIIKQKYMIQNFENYFFELFKYKKLNIFVILSKILLNIIKKDKINILSKIKKKKASQNVYLEAISNKIKIKKCFCKSFSLKKKSVFKKNGIISKNNLIENYQFTQKKLKIFDDKSLVGNNCNVEFPNIEDPILFIDSIYNQILINNNEQENNKNKFSRDDYGVKMQFDKLTSNEISHNSFSNATKNKPKFYQNNQFNNHYFVDTLTQENDPFEITLKKKAHNKIKKMIVFNAQVFFKVFNSIRLLVSTKNLIIFPIFLIFVNTKFKSFPLNLSFSSSSKTIFSTSLL